MQEINLYKLLAFYAKNWLLILSLTLAGLLGGFIYNQFVQVPMYKSEATILFINPEATNSAQDTTIINNYVELFSSRRVIEPVIQEQKIDIAYDTLVKSISATNEKGTEVIRLSVSTDNSKTSSNFLKAAVVSFKEKANELYGKDNLKVVDNASNAEPAYNVNKPIQLLLATAIGFIVSCISLFIVYDIRGDVPKVNKAKKIKTVAAKVKTTKPLKAKKAKKIKTHKDHTKAEKAPRTPIMQTAIIRGIKTYFTEYKEDFVMNPPVAERVLDEDRTVSLKKSSAVKKNKN
jgi:capsular polysaccharide biosynthesis protein